MRVLCALLLLSCTGDPPEPPRITRPAPAPTTPEPTPPEPTVDLGPLAATCDPTNNALRFDCAVHVDPPQPVSVTFAPADGSRPPRTHRSDAVAADHRVGLFLMPPGTPYTYVVAADDPEVPVVTGTFTTGPLPDPVSQLVVSTEGTSTAGPIGFLLPCGDGGTVVVVDPGAAGVPGPVLWYHPLVVGLGFVDAVTFTEGSVLAVVGGGLREVDRMGRELLRLDAGAELPNRVHHDVFRRGDRVYTLFQDPVTLDGTQFLLDGFYVVQDGAVVGAWRLIDHVTPSPQQVGFPVDWSHANAIWVDEAGREALVSLRHQSAVLRVVADPDDAAFGTVLWAMTPPGSEIPSDLVLSSAVGPPADFQEQHNVFELADGRIAMFDNRADLDDPSRVLEIAVDPVSGAAVIERSDELPVHCPFQGGALRTPADHPLATCAPLQTAYEFDAAGELTFVLGASCTASGGRYIPRFSPVVW